jgi:hypothetical protein
MGGHHNRNLQNDWFLSLFEQLSPTPKHRQIMNKEFEQTTRASVEIYPNGMWAISGDLDWDGAVIFCPREKFGEAHMKQEFNRLGVYILRGQMPDQCQPTIYIGEGDPVKNRLESHFLKKKFWEELFVCVSSSGKPNKAHIQHLESRLITLAKGAQRCKLDNDVDPDLPTLTNGEKNSVNTYLSNLLLILRVLGLKIFDKANEQDTVIEDKLPGTKGERTIPSLVIRGFLKPNDRLKLIKAPRADLKINDEKARHATFKSEQEIIWDFDGGTYSLSKLCKKMCEQFGGDLGSGAFQGPLYWAKEGQNISLADFAKSLDSQSPIKI